MRTKTLSLLFSLSLLFLFSACNNDDDSMLPEECSVPLSSSYYPLAVGNYWIYENYRIQPDTMDFLKYDTVTITGTQDINGNEYYVIERQNNLFSANQTEKGEYLARDSSGFIVNAGNEILLSTEVFDEVVYSTVIGETFVTEYQSLSSLQSTSVPAGDFEALNYQGRTYRNDTPDFEDVFVDHLFVEGIGKIFQNATYISNPWSTYFERRLVEYSIQ